MRPFNSLSELSYISFLHQTTTSRPKGMLKKHCLISHFYIKPQLKGIHQLLIFQRKNHGTRKDKCTLQHIQFYLNISISPSTLILKSTPSTRAWKSDKDKRILARYDSPFLYAPALHSLFIDFASLAS